jgi:predicted dinucleotide-binding enzyme
MEIAIIGTGNIGSTLARRFAENNHQIFLGVRNEHDFKGLSLLSGLKNCSIHSIAEAAHLADIIIIAVPAQFAIDVAKSLGDVTGKVIIDTMNSGNVKHEGFTNTTDAILANCNTTDVVKCFNTTGFENLMDPIYNNHGIDMFTAGSSTKGTAIATQLAKELGFENVYHFGNNDKFYLIEQMAMCWINLAIMQKQGRGMAFKIIKR